MKGPSDVPDSGQPASITPSLLVRLKAHDPEAWRRLVALYGPVVYDWCRRAGLQAADAADVGQEVFRGVLQGLPRFRRDRPGDTFRGWLWAITRHKLQDLRRRRAGRPEAAGGTSAQQRLLELPEDPDSDTGSSATPGGPGSLFRRAVELIRGDFEERTWQAFWRTAVEERSPADVAAELGMSPGAVYVARSRVLRRLREELAELIE